jgi:UrcA family protein
MFRMPKTASLATLAVLASGALCQSATAQQVTRSVAIRLGDLDLGSGRGAEAALSRIRGAAVQICGPSYPFTKMSLSEQEIFNQCLVEAEDRAVSDLDRPLVTALYQGKRQSVQLAQNSRR